MNLKVAWTLLILAAYANATVLTNDPEDEDTSIEDTNPNHFYDPHQDSDSWDYYYQRKEQKPTLSEDAIFLPHEKYCQYFYAFDGRDSYIYRCASGYRFDAEKLQCLKTKYVSCGKRKKDTGSSEEKNVGINFKCPKWSGLHPHNYYCHLFFTCENKKPYLFMCPPGKLFDQKSSKCLSRGRVNCGKHVNPYGDEDTNEDSTPDEETDITYRCPDSTGVFPDREHCNKFIRCWYGIGETYVCPKGKLFDIDLGKCMPRSSVYCDDRIDPDSYKDNEEPILIDKYPYVRCMTLFGRAPHETDCEKFYQCEYGDARLYACPSSKLYDVHTYSCRDASEVDCQSKPVTDDTDDDFVCPAKEGTFKDEENCGSYYKCKRGQAEHLRCPDGELFDTDWKSCNDENEVTCGDRLLPGDEPDEENEDSIIDENPSYKCERRHGRFTHDDICNWYYHCKDGRSSVKSCRRGRYYDTHRHSCYEDVDCGFRKPKEDEVKPTPKPREFTCPAKNGKYVHPKDCRAYYLCEKSKHKVHHCPKDKLFHEKELRCVDENLVTCGTRSHPDIGPDDHESKEIDPNPRFDCKSRFGNFDNEQYCDWYYNCHDSKASLKECKRGKYYDSKKRKCHPHKDVSCGGRKTPEDRETSTTESDIATKTPEFQCPKKEGKYPHERYCDKFYDCKKGEHKVHECPKHKLFDERSKKCEDEKKVTCGNRIHPDDITTKEPGFQCPKHDGKFPHERDCGKFYDCKKGKHKVHDCPKHKLFNEHSKKCEDEDKVTCGRRIHPDDDPEEPEDNVVDPNPDFTCKSYHGRYSHHNCDWYYHCRDRRPTVRECRRGRYYDRRSNRCKNSIEVDCDDRIRPEDRTTYIPPTKTSQETSTTPSKETTPTQKEATTESPTTEQEITTPSPTTTTTTQTPETSTAAETPSTTYEPITEEEDDNPDKIVDPKPNYDCSGDEGDFGHDGYCHYYYSCKNNRVTLRECPEGKFFDIERGYCEDWYIVDCGDRVRPGDDDIDDFQSTPYDESKHTTSRPKETTTREPVSEKPKFVCPTSEGNYPQEKNCGKYYKCTNGIAEEIKCPDGQLYDLDKKSCNDEQETNCGKRIHPMDDPDNPDKVPDKVIDPNPEFNCTSRHGCFTHEMFCKWYYYCHDKRPEVRECSGDQYFDSTRNKCLEWWMVFCEDRIVPDQTTFKPTSITATPSSRTDDGRTGNTGDDRTGSTGGRTRTTPSGRGTGSTDGRTGNTGDDRTGSTGGRTRSTTPSGRGTGSTDSGTRSTGRDRGTSSTDGRTGGTGGSSIITDKGRTTDSTTPSLPVEDMCKEEDGDFQHPDDCRKYYTCKDGEYTVNVCPVGTLFDKNMRICYKEDLVDCGNRYKPEMTTQTPDDCDEWLRTRTTSPDDRTTSSEKGTTGPNDKGTGGTESTDGRTNDENTTGNPEDLKSTPTIKYDITTDQTHNPHTDSGKDTPSTSGDGSGENTDNPRTTTESGDNKSSTSGGGGQESTVESKPTDNISTSTDSGKHRQSTNNH